LRTETVTSMSDATQRSARRNVRLLLDLNRRQVEAAYASVRTGRVRSVGIVGAGVMGASIVAAVLKHEIPVVITDVDKRALARLPAAIAANLSGRPGTSGAPGSGAIGRMLQRTDDVAEIARCDLVVEAVVEDLSVKRQLLAELEGKLAGGAVLTSNTSVIPIARLAETLTRPSRFCGLHFLMPSGERSMVEIVRGPASSRQTVATAVAFAKAIDHVPLVVDDGPGFLVNRLMLPYLSEALQLLTEGAGIEAIETAAMRFGMATGPLALIDMIGLDTVLNCAWVLSGISDDLVVHSPLLVAMVKAGRRGRKSGAGFFAYRGDPDKEETPPGVPDPAVDEIISRWALPPRRRGEETIIARLILPMLLEATRTLQRKGMGDPRTIDLAVVLGFGFPAARGGLLYWADTLGAARIVEMLRPLESLGPRIQATPLLLEMAAKKRRFYDATTADPTEGAFPPPK